MPRGGSILGAALAGCRVRVSDKGRGLGPVLKLLLERGRSHTVACYQQAAVNDVETAAAVKLVLTRRHAYNQPTERSVRCQQFLF